MIIPYGIHDVHGTMNWLWSQPTLIPWIPHGIPHGFHMDYTGEGKDLTICAQGFEFEVSRYFKYLLCLNRSSTELIGFAKFLF